MHIFSEPVKGKRVIKKEVQFLGYEFEPAVFNYVRIFRSSDNTHSFTAFFYMHGELADYSFNPKFFLLLQGNFQAFHHRTLQFIILYHTYRLSQHATKKYFLVFFLKFSRALFNQGLTNILNCAPHIKNLKS
ncbi:MAG TPA: hypothetical protein DCM31_05530 [Deferribacteraceae bacterium]|nr:hypothetical protein [Deferribacteraceae bacterium]